MLISKSGSSAFSPNSRRFLLNDMLLVPSSTKNLLSVRKVCADNSVFVEITVQRVVVRDTQKLVLEG